MIRLAPLALVLAACTPAPEPEATRNLTAEERACVRSTAILTETPEVVVLGTTPEDPLLRADLAAGPARERWRCTAFPDVETAMRVLAEEGIMLGSGRPPVMTLQTIR